MDSVAAIVYKIKNTLIHIEKFIAAASLLLLLLLSLSQVILRNLFELGFSNIDVITRHLVLFVTFMGAALISETNQHIKIDCINSLLSYRIRRRLRRPLLLISAIVSAAFCVYSIQFWLEEQQYAPANEQLALWLALILPAGFFILGLHLFLLFLLPTETHPPAESD